MQVSEILQEKGSSVVTVGPDCLVAEATKILQSEGIGAILVMSDSGEILGILSERDIVRRLAFDGASVLSVSVSDVMTKKVLTCSPDTDSESLMEKMLSAHIRHLPVVSDGALVGIISIGDVVKSVVVGLKWVRSALQRQVIASAGWSIDED